MDQLSDSNGQKLFALLRAHEAPQFVKDASSDDIYGNDLPPKCYADPIRRQFPIHTKSAAWVSSLFYYHGEAAHKPDYNVAGRLKSAADWFGIRSEVDALESKAVDAPSDDDYAVVFTNKDGEVERYYPIRNASEVKAAAQYLFKHRDLIPFADKSNVADKILTKAAAFGVDLGDLDDFLERAAGRGMCSADTAASLLEQRVTLARQYRYGSALVDSLTKAAAACRDNPASVKNESSLMKLAEAVDRIDREFGFHQRYDADGIDRPEDVLFSVTPKLASQFLNQHCSTTTGNVYNVNDLSKVAVEAIQDVLGDDVAGAVKEGGRVSVVKLAELISTLPRPDAALMDKLLAAQGIRPVMTESNGSAGWMTNEVLDGLARV